MVSILSKEDIFQEKAIKVHGNKYTYSKVIYKNSKTKVTISCKYHGDFSQTPGNHLKGAGCPKCGLKVARSKQLKPLISFISEANALHKCAYTYDKVEYKNSDTKIIITCKIHGDFSQRPIAHLRGSGCPKCGRIKANKSLSLTCYDFKHKASIKHNNKYDYSLVEYKNYKSVVKIMCPIHGIYKQLAGVHLSGCGCPNAYPKHGISSLQKIL